MTIVFLKYFCPFVLPSARPYKFGDSCPKNFCEISHLEFFLTYVSTHQFLLTYVSTYQFLLTYVSTYQFLLTYGSRSQWPRGLKHRFSAARLLRLWVRIPPRAWMFVRCECCVLSGRGLCDGLITRPEESYRLWRVVVCDQETSNTRRLKPATGL